MNTDQTLKENSEMKISKFILFAIIFLSNSITAQDSHRWFPLYRIGIEVLKEDVYYLLTPENVSQLKNELVLIDVCDETRVSVEKFMNNRDYQVFMNEEDVNEVITFFVFPHFTFGDDMAELLQRKLKEHCYDFGQSSIENLSIKNGSAQLGNFVSLLNKITTPKLSYYSEAYFFEGRNATITIILTSVDKRENIDFVRSARYINTERYQKLLDESILLIGKEDYTNAASKLERAMLIEPENVMAFELRAKNNLALKNNNAAIADANQILSIDDANINGYLIKGIALYNNRKYKESIAMFEMAQYYYSLLASGNEQNEYFCSFAEMYRLIGEAYMNLGNPTSATENLELALVMAYDSLSIASLYYNLGVVKSDLLKDAMMGIDYYSIAIQNYPVMAKKQKSEAYYNRGLNKRFLNDYTGAISDYSSAIELRPGYIKAYNNRGYARMLMENFQMAIDDFTTVIEYDSYATEILI